MIAVRPEQRDAALPGTVSSPDFKDALSRASTAVTVVATNGSFGLAGLTCSSVCSVCDDPPTVLLCVNRRSFAAGVIRQNGVVSVNWLATGHEQLSQIFAGVGAVPMEKRFSGAAWETIATGAPCLADAAIAFDCVIVNIMDVGSHSVMFAHVVARQFRHDAAPLVYCRREYATTRPFRRSITTSN